MIKSFRCKDTESIFCRVPVKRFSTTLQRAALRKLLILDAATDMNDLRRPPGNRLEKLVGDREGQHSIRVNDQFRICFRWQVSDVFDVEMVDYH